MIKTLIVSLVRKDGTPTPRAEIEARLNLLADEGFFPLCSCFIPAANGPGALHYTLGDIGARAADETDDKPANGTGHPLPEPEIVNPAT